MDDAAVPVQLTEIHVAVRRPSPYDSSMGTFANNPEGSQGGNGHPTPRIEAGLCQRGCERRHCRVLVSVRQNRAGIGRADGRAGLALCRVVCRPVAAGAFRQDSSRLSGQAAAQAAAARRLLPARFFPVSDVRPSACRFGRGRHSQRVCAGAHPASGFGLPEGSRQAGSSGFPSACPLPASSSSIE